MPRSRPIAELVDDLLAAPKELAGSNRYLEPNRPEEQARSSWPVLVNGKSEGCTVACTFYPNDVDLRFTISLVFRSINLWRLDFEPDHRVEQNPPLAGHPYSNATIRGPHWHRWTENRHSATHSSIPPTLRFRAPYEGPRNGPNVWENAFRLFLGETGITQPEASRMPRWPKMERLL